MKVPRERIVAAAIKRRVSEIYTLPRPNRHEDIRNLMRKEGLNPSDSSCTEGFMTDSRKFVTRVQARKIAEKSGQILPSEKDKAGFFQLTTLDLW